jgi:hypothetical protein
VELKGLTQCNIRLLASQYMYASLMLSSSGLVFYPLMIRYTTRMSAASHRGVSGKACEGDVVAVRLMRPSSYMLYGASTAKVLSPEIHRHFLLQSIAEDVGLSISRPHWRMDLQDLLGTHCTRLWKLAG